MVHRIHDIGRSSIRTTVGGLLLVGAGSGCSKTEPKVEQTHHTDRVVETVCESYTTCDCTDATSLTIQNDCTTAIRPAVENAMANARDLSLTYHQECLDRFAKILDYAECRTGYEFEQMIEGDDSEIRDLTDEMNRCKLVSGRARRGETCASIPVVGSSLFGDTCGHDLVCADGLCRPWPTKEGDWCGAWSDCPVGLTCIDPDGDAISTCEVPRQNGETCNVHDGPNACDVDLACDEDTLTCGPIPGVGQACPDGICQTGAVCIEDTCEALLNLGQDCSEGVCNPELGYCDPETVECIAWPTLSESCEDTGQCETGLVCDDEQVCVKPAPIVCGLPDDVGVCPYQGDGICDEAEGTGLCSEGTDPLDCADEGSATSGATGGIETGDFTSGGDSFTSGDDGFTSGDDGFTSGDDGFETGDFTTGVATGGSGEFCEYADDGVCDEPEGTGICPEGTDPFDCE